VTIQLVTIEFVTERPMPGISNKGRAFWLTPAPSEANEKPPARRKPAKVIADLMDGMLGRGAFEAVKGINQ
jgi:hypothetical protein